MTDSPLASFSVGTHFGFNVLRIYSCASLNASQTCLPKVDCFLFFRCESFEFFYFYSFKRFWPGLTFFLLKVLYSRSWPLHLKWFKEILIHIFQWNCSECFFKTNGTLFIYIHLSHCWLISCNICTNSWTYEEPIILSQLILKGRCISSMILR